MAGRWAGGTERDGSWIEGGREEERASEHREETGGDRGVEFGLRVRRIGNSLVYKIDPREKIQLLVAVDGRKSRWSG